MEKEIKIIAKVIFNNRFAYVIDRKPKLIFKKVDNIIYGTDGLFYDCYQYEEPEGRFKAFAGRKFEIKLDNGEIVKCNGQWWNGGFKNVEDLVGCNIDRVTIRTKKDLKKCYVFCGYEANIDKFNKLIKILRDD